MKRLLSTHVDHVSVSPTNKIGPTQGHSLHLLQRRFYRSICGVLWELKANTTSTTANATFSDVTLRFCNHFLSPNYACKMCCDYIPDFNWNQRFRLEVSRHTWAFVIICSHRPHNCKTAHFTSWKERERQRDVQKNARAKRAKLLFFFVKYANLWRSSCRRCRGG